MKNICTFLFSFLSVCAFSQQDSLITKVLRSELYIKNGTTYNFKELAPFLNRFPDSKYAYERKYKQSQKVAGIFLGLSIASFGIGAMSNFDEDMYCDLICVDTQKIFGFLFGSVFLVGALATNQKALNARSEIIDYYNAHFDSNIGFYKNPLYLNFQLNQNGAGVVLSF